MALNSEQAEQLIKEFKENERAKQPWNNHWQLVGEFIFTRKSMFTRDVTQGEFLNDDLYDSTAPQALETMASALIGQLWPNGARSIKLQPARGIDEFDVENKEYFETVTERLVEAMDDPKAGLMTALEEYMMDQGAFGTSGVGIFEGDEEIGSDLVYQAWDVKRMVIVEGKWGRIDTVFIEKEFTLKKMIQQYGFSNIHEEFKEAAKEGPQNLDRKEKVLHVIKPRNIFRNQRLRAQDMPFMSAHIDMKNKHVLRESGFEEMPVKIARFSKRIGETYGRSPGMKALPDVMELNAIWEGLTLAIEKTLEPPLAVLDDGWLGNGKVDVSPGAINVVRVNGRIDSSNPIQPIFTVGNIQEVEPLVTKLENAIVNRFGIDRLLDLNNEHEMTLGEARIRNQLRAATLRSLYSRQISELFTPLVERSFNILFRKGVLGVVAGSPQEQEMLARGEEPLYIPDQIVQQILQGKEIYKIVYFTPAMRILQSDEIEGIFQTWQFISENSQVAPGMVDIVDEDESVRRIAINSGMDVGTLHSKEAVIAQREERAKAAERAQQMQEAREGSEIARNAKQAELI